MTQAFRQLIRDLVADWFRQHAASVDQLGAVLVSACGPAVEKAVRDGVLEQLGQIEPTEREALSQLLQRSADDVTRFVTAGNSERVDAVANRLRAAAIALRTRQALLDVAAPQSEIHNQGGKTDVAF